MNKQESYLARVTNTGSAFDGALVKVCVPEADSQGRVQAFLYGWESSNQTLSIAESCLERV